MIQATGRLIVVSNRVPNPAAKTAQAGGLAVAIHELLSEMGGIWFGWNGKVGSHSRADPAITKDGAITYATMELSRRDYTQYYNGFANRSLWPLFHYRLDLTLFDRGQYYSYVDVNRRFAEKLTKLLRKNDLIWVHDYHLIPLAAELHRLGNKQVMGFFLHTPFPAVEILTALPAHEELVAALCQYDLVGFQTKNDRRAFADFIQHVVGGRVLRNKKVEAHGRAFEIGVFPVGIDPEPFARAALDPKRMARGRRLKEQYGDTAWLIGVDRLDYSKGLIERFRSFEKFLDKYPQYRKEVTFFQIAPPSRSEVPEYSAIRHELEAEAGHINGRFAELDWVPINYINKSYDRDQLAAFYRDSRIGFVTPLRDGMNLVAKEYVAAQNPTDPGVLVLSRFAGAARELDGALIVNPFNHDAVADAIARGLEMPQEERYERWDSMISTVKRDNIGRWGKTYLNALRRAGSHNQRRARPNA